MAAEDYIDEYDVDEEMYAHPGDVSSKYPDDFPCRKCRYSRQYRCTRRKGIDRCPSASWFAEHNKEERK